MPRFCCLFLSIEPTLFFIGGGIFVLIAREGSHITLSRMINTKYLSMELRLSVSASYFSRNQKTGIFLKCK